MDYQPLRVSVTGDDGPKFRLFQKCFRNASSKLGLSVKIIEVEAVLPTEKLYLNHLRDIGR